MDITMLTAALGLDTYTGKVKPSALEAKVGARNEKSPELQAALQLQAEERRARRGKKRLENYYLSLKNNPTRV